MARALIANTTCALNSEATQTETTYAGGLTGTSGLYVDDVDVDEKFLLYVRKTAGATGSIWIMAGGFDDDGQGNLEVYIGAGAAKIIGPLEGARYRQSDGTIDVDMGVTGIVSAIKLP